MAPRSLLQLPVDTLTGAHRHHAAVRERIAGRHLPVPFVQRDGAGIARQAVKIGRQKNWQSPPVCPARRRCSKASAYSSMAACAVYRPAQPQALSLAPRCVRGAVGAEEQFRVAAGGRLQQRLAVLLALQHRQTVVVRANAATETWRCGSAAGGGRSGCRRRWPARSARSPRPGGW